ncbi:MAG TPA: dihydrofolate reductase [Burkholderiales bacterium]|nr:dihydrofolate reductase [Burkholderiales bacterium]
MSQPPAPAIYLVAAVAANGIIGANGRLPWHLPGELQHFKKLTMGHPIIMGRRTWESLRGPLPGRENVVVTTTAGYRAEGAAVARSLDAAVALCLGEPVAFVIGGTRLFAEALPIARGMVLTEIHRDYEGDSVFPTFERSQWRETQREANTAPDGTRFDYVLYERA